MQYIKLFIQGLCHLKLLSHIVLISLLFCQPYSALGLSTASTANTIVGNVPRFVQSIENSIESKQEFSYFGVTYNNNSYFSTETLNSALGVNVASMTPNSLNLGYVLAAPSESEAFDIDGDGDITLSEASTGSVTLDWYYENTSDTEIKLTTEQKNMKFSNLIISGIYPYIKIQGNVALQTKYGDPSVQVYPDSSLLVTEIPFRIFNVSVGGEAIKFASPNMLYSSGIYSYGDTTKFNPTTQNGFVPQDDYLNNFPSTGANGLYFYIVTEGVNNTLETTEWTVKTSDTSSNPIRAEVTKSVAPRTTGFKSYDATNMVLVTLKGPDASVKDSSSATAPSANLPVDIEIIGKTKQGVILSYMFRIDKWFINSGQITNSPIVQTEWCSNLGSYRLATVRELSNARHNHLTDNLHNNYNYKRAVHEGLITEWGGMAYYNVGSNTVPGFFNTTYGWTSTVSTNGNNYYVNMNDAALNDDRNSNYNYYALCISQ